MPSNGILSDTHELVQRAARLGPDELHELETQGSVRLAIWRRCDKIFEPDDTEYGRNHLMNGKGQVCGFQQFFDNAHDGHCVVIANSICVLVAELRDPFPDGQVKTKQQDLIPQPSRSGPGIPFERGQILQFFIQIEVREVFEPALPPLPLSVYVLLRLLRRNLCEELLF